METPIVVIGGSAGSIGALRELFSQFPTDFAAAVFVVVHTNRHSKSHLASVFQRASLLPVSFASDHGPIKPGHIYIAPPDHHLFLETDQMRLIRGALENNMRPAIDVLFRSAAVAHRNAVVGVLLSGMLDDGVLGLVAIQRCGGQTVVQSPEEALFGDMPKNAIAAVEIDHVVAIAQMTDTLLHCLRQPPSTKTAVPQDLAQEAQMARRVTSSPDAMAQIGDMVAQSCPACGGPLWQVKSAPISQHRCHIGHSFTAPALVEAQAHRVEEALWLAFRTLEERGRLLERISATSGNEYLSQTYEQRAQEAFHHADSLRQLLYSLDPEDIAAAAADPMPPQDAEA